ncbi:MAG: hypothetical protein AAGA53_16340 [Pseudomonadota bacterium]
MPNKKIVIRPVRDVTEAYSVYDRLQDLLDNNDPDREFIAERPVSEIKKAIEDGLFIVCETEDEEMIGSLALYPLDEDYVMTPGYELGTVMIDKAYRRFRRKNEGFISHAISSACILLLVANRIKLNILAYVRAKNTNPDRVLKACGFNQILSDKPPKKKFELAENCFVRHKEQLQALDFSSDNPFEDDKGNGLCIRFEGWLIDSTLIAQLPDGPDML